MVVKKTCDTMELPLSKILSLRGTSTNDFLKNRFVSDPLSIEGLAVFMKSLYRYSPLIAELLLELKDLNTVTRTIKILHRYDHKIIDVAEMVGFFKKTLSSVRDIESSGESKRVLTSLVAQGVSSLDMSKGEINLNEDFKDRLTKNINN